MAVARLAAAAAAAAVAGDELGLGLLHSREGRGGQGEGQDGHEVGELHLEGWVGVFGLLVVFGVEKLSVAELSGC